jgi:hypothetical protein
VLVVLLAVMWGLLLLLLPPHLGQHSSRIVLSLACCLLA